MDYKHFIITRFNLRHVSKGDGTDKSGKSVLTDEWLAHRIDLFNNYCLPSVANQSNKNFTWLLYFDSTTSQEVRDKNHILEKRYAGLIKVFYVDGQEGFINSYTSDILSLCPKDTKWVITSRLDNDDIVHKDYIRKVQDSFNGQEFTAVNFLKILMVSPGLQDKLHIDYIFSNHFISVIESITPEGIKGCYSRADRQWVNVSTVQITDKPYCIELISEKNLVNEFRGFPVFKRTSLADFQINTLIKNKILDIDNLRVWKMSWMKLIRSWKFI